MGIRMIGENCAIDDVTALDAAEKHDEHGEHEDDGIIDQHQNQFLATGQRFDAQR